MVRLVHSGLLGLCSFFVRTNLIILSTRKLDFENPREGAEQNNILHIDSPMVYSMVTEFCFLFLLKNHSDCDT